jgi:hypothetical protein
MDTITDFYPNANWASLVGAYTPKELRDIADEIEKKHKEFKDGNKK